MSSTRVAPARAVQAEPTLGDVQALEIYDPLVAQFEAALEHRRALVAARTLLLHHIGDQIAKLPTEVRDQLGTSGKSDARLARLATIDPALASTPAGAYRLGWLRAHVEADRAARKAIRQFNATSTVSLMPTAPPRGMRPGSAPFLPPPCCVRSATPPGSHANHSSPVGVALARWRCHLARVTTRRCATVWTPAATGPSTACCTSPSVTQQRNRPDARDHLARKTAEGKPTWRLTRPQTPPHQPHHPTHVARRNRPETVTSPPWRSPVCPAAGPCSYANICKQCHNYQPALALRRGLRDQLADVTGQHADAQQRGWTNGPHATSSTRSTGTRSEPAPAHGSLTATPGTG